MKSLVNALIFNLLLSLTAYSASYQMKAGESAIAFLLRTNNFHIHHSLDTDEAVQEYLRTHELTEDMFKESIGLAVQKKRAIYLNGEAYPAFGNSNIFFSGGAPCLPESESFKQFLRAGGKELYVKEEEGKGHFVFYPGTPELQLKFDLVMKIRFDKYNPTTEINIAKTEPSKEPSGFLKT